MEYRTIRELCELVVDCPHSTPTWTNCGKIVIRNQYIKNGRIDFSAPSYTNEEHFLQRIKRAKPKYGDIIITREAPIGDVGMIPEGIECCLGQRMVLLRANPKICDKYYLLYCLQSRYVQHQISWSEGTGTTVSNLRIPHLEQLKIPYPPMETQRKIASILRSIEEKMGTNRKINDNLQQQAQALFVAWFVNFIPFGGTAPDDWQYVRFANFLTPRTEKSNDPSLPMFSVTDTGIYPRDEKFKKNLSMSNTKNKVIYNTDLVFGMSREILNWGIMRYAIGGISSAYNVFSVSDTINSFYLESYIKHNGSYFRDLIKPASREGQGIDKNVLMQKQILLPPFDVLQSYYSIENALTRKVAYNQAENARLAELRDTLLPRLMSGEVDVSNIDI